ncbi:MAG: hypothetical protein ACE37F_04960 [Nannocystaceae bacterium]|nr:hypothetical protein [bacterium]
MIDPTKSPLEYICDAAFLSAMRALTEGYIVVGSSATGQLGSATAGGGMDLVWDLWNEQFAVYAYPQGGLSYFNISAGAQVYTGFGFGNHPHIHSAWSGWFRGAQAAVNIDVFKLISLEGSVSYFESPDRSTVGGLVGVGASVSVPRIRDVLRLPLGASAAGVAAGFWTPVDNATRGLSRANPVFMRPAANERNHAVVNLEPGRWGVTLHLAQTLGTSALTPGFTFYASAVSLLKEYMQARGLASDRRAGVQQLHNWACSETYRIIQQYRSDVPTGTTQREYPGGHTIARTPRGKYLITSSVGGSGAVGSWTTVMKLRTADNGYGGVPSVRYGMAMRGARTAILNGRSVPMMRLSDELMQVRRRMNAA